MKPYNASLKLNSQKLRSAQTEPEKRLWERIRNDQLLGFRFYRQKPLLSYIVDFYCPKANLVIELDGRQHYEHDHWENDRIRDAELNSIGLQVLRFDNQEVLCELDTVIDKIVKNFPTSTIPPL
ncbi:endonuclease domain-containing protein [Lonepinella sp. BR2271]|uniref:endonuclease domain-containing protein n=1 Tax=Lonepinella sp. BR2271 TaxID=3434550 RepID=UPI003F6E27AB